MVQQCGSGNPAALLCQTLEDVKALLANGELSEATARSVVGCAFAMFQTSEAGSVDQLAALEVLEECSAVVAGARAMYLTSNVCELLLTVAVEQKHSAHQIAAIAAVANISASSREARLALVQMGVTELLLSLASDPELMGTEPQHPALISLTNLACERSNLFVMAEAGTLDIIMMLLSTPAVTDSDLCVLVLNLLLAFTVAGPEALVLLQQHEVSISVMHLFMTRPNGRAGDAPASSLSTPPHKDLQSTVSPQELYNESQTITLQILCNMANDSDSLRSRLYASGLPGLVLTVLSSDQYPAEHQLWAMRILAACAHTADILAQLAASDAADVLLDFASRESLQGTEAQKLALNTLVLLSRDDIGTTLILARGLPLLHALVSMPQVLGSSQQLLAVEMLAWMTSKGLQQRLTLMCSGIPAALIALIAREELAGHPLMGPALVTLNNLSAEEESRLELIEAGILQVLANVIVFECPGTDWQGTALGIVCSFAELDEPRVHEAFVTSGVIESISCLLVHYTTDLTASCMPNAKDLRLSALQVSVNLSAAPAGTARAMVQQGVVEALMTVAGNEQENRHPNTSSEQHQLYAIKALKNLSSEPSCAPLLQKKGAQQLLENLEKDIPDVMANLDGAIGALAALSVS